MALDTRIYVMTHKKYTKPDNEEYISLHVGREGKEDLGYLGDNSNDNISNKNRNYCELTGLYWLWKNVQCDMIGICHYRRYFFKDRKVLSKEYIEHILGTYDLILPTSSGSPYKDTFQHYEEKHVIRDLLTCEEVIKEKYPAYSDSFQWCMKTNLFSVGNMMIARKEVFDEYCLWLFDILFEVEKRIDISSYDEYQSRVMGFLSERLLRVWLLMQDYKIKEEVVKMIDLEELENGIKLVQLKYRYVCLMMNDLVEKYKAMDSKDFLIKVEKRKEGETKKEKIPVWICWWQGIENAPEYVKLCVESVKNNIPSTHTQLHLISLENVLEYVQFPDHIIKKFNEGKITLTHLSDILRAELLFRYGGMWIDATYYVQNPLPVELFTGNPIFTQKTEKPLWEADIVQGRWAGNLLKGPAGFVLFQFMTEAFCEYWKKNDSMIDYYLIDYIIAVAYENLPAVKEALDSCAYNNQKVFELHNRINEPFDQHVFDMITSDTQFFKLRSNSNYNKITATGKETFYGYLVRMSGK